MCSEPDHPLTCRAGRGVIRPHKAIASLLALSCKEARYDACVEAVLPEFLCNWQCPDHSLDQEGNRLEKAVLDIVTTHPILSHESILDATVRHLMSTRLASSRFVAGAAAAQGEGDRIEPGPYPPTHGRQVTPCAIETWGSVSRVDPIPPCPRPAPGHRTWRPTWPNGLENSGLLSTALLPGLSLAPWCHVHTPRLRSQAIYFNSTDAAVSAARLLGHSHVSASHWVASTAPHPTPPVPVATSTNHRRRRAP